MSFYDHATSNLQSGLLAVAIIAMSGVAVIGTATAANKEDVKPVASCIVHADGKTLDLKEVVSFGIGTKHRSTQRYYRYLMDDGTNRWLEIDVMKISEMVTVVNACRKKLPPTVGLD